MTLRGRVSADPPPFRAAGSVLSSSGALYEFPVRGPSRRRSLWVLVTGRRWGEEEGGVKKGPILPTFSWGEVKTQSSAPTGGCWSEVSGVDGSRLLWSRSSFGSEGESASEQLENTETVSGSDVSCCPGVCWGLTHIHVSSEHQQLHCLS